MSRSWRKPPNSCARRWVKAEGGSCDRAAGAIKPGDSGSHARRALHRVMRGLDPRINLLRERSAYEVDGLHRNSGLPEFRIIECRKSGKPTCGVKPGNDEKESRVSPRLAFLLHPVPPGADAGREIVVAVDDLHRLALAILGRLDAEAPRLLLLFGRHPAPLVPPQARAELALERLPAVVVDELPAPTVFHQEAGGIPGVERGDVVAGMAPERDADALGCAEREIVALADVVEAVELDHHMMDHVDAAL